MPASNQSSGDRLRIVRIKPRARNVPGILPAVSLAGDDSFTSAAENATAVGTMSGTKPADRFWLDGGSVFGWCPDCEAPVTIRVWLALADCWSCGANIELTYEEQLAIKNLLAGSSIAPHSDSAESPPDEGAQRDHDLDGGSSAESDVDVAAISRAIHNWDFLPDLGQDQDIVQPVPFHLSFDDDLLAASSHVRTAPHRNWLQDLPAWLVSMAIHLLLLLLLAMLALRRHTSEPTITLSMAVNRMHRSGDQPAALSDEVRFDLPIPSDVDLNSPRQRELLRRADQDARPLRIDPDSLDPQLPDLQHVKSRLQQQGPQKTFAARDPRLRRQVLRHEGGTLRTEAAVARGLAWLAHRQNADGSWTLPGHREKTAGTALALLPFLGAGQTHLFGHYKENVSGGLRFLLQHQKNNGDLRGDASSKYGMYAHGQATIVVCETLAMTQDELFREPSQRAVDFIAEAQYPDGGWRYRTADELREDRPRGDTSVVGWQVMALSSAGAAGLEVPPETLSSASQFLKSVTTDRRGASYAYQTSRSPTPSMTAEGLLCRVYLGWRKDHPGLRLGTQYLLLEHPPEPRNANIYYWYYATQLMHHYGGRRWETWNKQLRDSLVGLQETRGANAGSWPTRIDPRGDAAGRLYVTAMAICTLEVYYRHAPIFRQIDLD